MIREMVMVKSYLVIKRATKDNGRQMFAQVKENLSRLMAPCMKAIGQTMFDKVMAYTKLLIARFMKACGQIT